MAKLHELLAVEGDLESNVIRDIDNATLTFTRKIENFRKYERHYKPMVENEPEQPVEYVPMVNTVDEILTEMMTSWSKYINVNIQKEYTNQIAKADLIVDGILLAKDVPATALLSLENKLKKLKNVFSVIPTLHSNEWDVDGDLSCDRYTIYKMKHDEQKNRTVKSFAHKVLVPPTDKHPAQIEKWEENIVVGKYIKYTWSSELPSYNKNNYLSKIDKLMKEIKMARQRANEAEIIKTNIGNEIMKFIFEK